MAQSGTKEQIERLTLVSLGDLLNETDHAAFLVESRVLRRVIKYDRNITGFGLQVPHRKSYTIARDPLLELVEPDELRPFSDLPETVILLQRPDPDYLESTEDDLVLLQYWRLLFHARIHLDLDSLLGSGRLTLAAVRQRIGSVGQTEFDEVRAVLRAERFLLPPRDLITVYGEFVAVYSELRMFAPHLVEQYFPSMHDCDEVDQVVGQDLDIAGLFEQTRLVGAAEPGAASAEVAPIEPQLTEPDRPTSRFRQKRNARRVPKLIKRAERVSVVGNVVRAALLRNYAAELATDENRDEIRASAQLELDRLTQRLQDALGFGDDDAEGWRVGLARLLSHSKGFWPVEARLLYDLQKVCIDHEREIYSVDLPGWVFSRGELPVRRPLPLQREVNMCKHLRNAAKRLTVAQITGSDRDRLDALLSHATHLAEQILRDSIRPLITQTFHDVELRPVSIPDRVARNKLTEELLDRIVHRGYLSMGDVRDAVSRNDLKLPDLKGPVELFKGDSLLQIDKHFQGHMDGVYRHGEVYLRLLQRVSSLVFGTRTGRFLTKYLALPFGGAFLILEGLQHILAKVYAVAYDLSCVVIEPKQPGLIRAASEAVPGGALERAGSGINSAVSDQAVVGAAAPIVGDATESATDGLRSTMTQIQSQFPWDTLERPEQAELGLSASNFGTLLVVGLLLLAMINSHNFRESTVRVLKWGRRLTYLLWGWATELLMLQLLWRLLRTRWFMLIRRYVLKPVTMALVLWAILSLYGLEIHKSPAGGLLLFVGMNIILNSRFGRDFEEVLNDWIVRSWVHFRGWIVTGVYWLIMDVFKGILERIDKFLYSVDEWLRFKSGESQLSFAMKASLGVVWYLVQYVIRFCVNLLIEPQFNPIKHFPVVTVSHKLLVPTIPIVAGILAPVVGAESGYLIGTTIIFLTPGIFGFLAWELKENWRLYRENRAARVQPVVIGRSGETLGRLMIPGVHSGTLPKLYKKLRKAERKAIGTGKQSSLKYREAIMQETQQLRYFVERELLFLLFQTPQWPYLVNLSDLSTGSNSVMIHLSCEEIDGDPMVLSLEEQSGWTVANLVNAGWVMKLDPDARKVFRNALIGFYKMAGVELVRSQLEYCLGEGGPPPPYDVSDLGLVVWPGRGYLSEVYYDLSLDGRMVPKVNGRRPENMPPPLYGTRAKFSLRPVRIEEWAAAWDAREPRLAPRLLDGVPLILNTASVD